MTESGWYMASTSNIDPKYRSTIGHIEGLANIRPVALRESKVWCLDNSVFTDRFEETKWLRQIERLSPWYEKCKFITIPDVVGDFAATLKQFYKYRKMVKDLPVALVSQDGIQQYADKIPWSDFDCLFIGGSDWHKLGTEGRWAIEEARKRGRRVHVGRCNSEDRILKFWDVDSWDGTTLSFEPSKVKRIHAAVLKARAMKSQKGLFDDLHSSVSAGDYSRQSL